MPTWAGVQISWISLHFSFSLVYVVNISYNRSWRLLDIPVLRLYSADNESLPIKTWLILSSFLIHSNAIMIAYNSTVYTFRSSVVLLLSSPPWLNIKTIQIFPYWKVGPYNSWAELFFTRPQITSCLISYPPKAKLLHLFPFPASLQHSLSRMTVSMSL